MMAFRVQLVYEYVLHDKCSFLYISFFIQGPSGEIGRPGSPGIPGPKGKFNV
jgi:hypothetical protein